MFMSGGWKGKTYIFLFIYLFYFIFKFGDMKNLVIFFPSKSAKLFEFTLDENFEKNHNFFCGTNDKNCPQKSLGRR